MKMNAKMKQTNTVKATREAVVAAARRAGMLRQKTAKLARDSQKTWKGSKSRQQATKQLEKAARTVVRFGKDVREGLKEGIAEVQKKNKRK